MSITDILIILGCLAGGYWLVSSVMGPGIDITRRDAEKPPAASPPAASPRGASRPLSLPRPNPHTADWHLLLDVPRTATRAEIEAAYRHQQKKSEAAGDRALGEKLRLAREAGLAQLAR